MGTAGLAPGMRLRSWYVSVPVVQGPGHRLLVDDLLTAGPGGLPNPLYLLLDRVSARPHAFVVQPAAALLHLLQFVSDAGARHLFGRQQAKPEAELLAVAELQAPQLLVGPPGELPGRPISRRSSSRIPW